jgi:3-phosphoglycerate kinase
MYQLKKDLQQYSLERIEDISNKTVVLRSCLNVTVNDSGKVIDDTRIVESLHTIQYLAEHAKRVVIIGHLGRPKGYSKELSFWSVADVLQRHLGIRSNVQFIEYGSDVEFTSNIVLSDNIRFFEDEESKDLEKRMNFAKELAELGDVFVNDAFADYRESASTYDIANLLPSYLGFKFIEEVENLSKLSGCKRPYVAVLGGSKLSEKLDVISSLGEQSDKILVGGAMAYTLMKAKDIDVGKSLIEEDKIDVAKEIVSKFGDKLVLPVDHLVSDTFNEYSSYEYVESEVVPVDSFAIDIGKNTVERFKKIISTAQTILWNGPLGVVEWDHSVIGTEEVGKAISETNAYKVLGGGDTIAAVNKLKLSGFDHICTGGGAMLAFLSNEKFPTLDVILK